MEKKTENAIDTIYKLDSRLSKLESSVKLLDDKLNTIIRLLGDPEKKMKEKVFLKGEPAPKTAINAEPAPKLPESESVEVDEVMEISSKIPSAPKHAIVASIQSNPATNKPIEIKPTLPPPAKQITMPDAQVDIFNSGEKVTCIVRGKYDSKHGNISNVAITIKDTNDKVLKNTKTTAGGDWLAVLPSGDYIVEFSRIAQQPIVKTISIMPGKKEMHVLI